MTEGDGTGIEHSLTQFVVETWLCYPCRQDDQRIGRRRVESIVGGKLCVSCPDVPSNDVNVGFAHIDVFLYGILAQLGGSGQQTVTLGFRRHSVVPLLRISDVELHGFGLMTCFGFGGFAHPVKIVHTLYEYGAHAFHDVIALLLVNVFVAVALYEHTVLVVPVVLQGTAQHGLASGLLVDGWYEGGVLSYHVVNHIVAVGF